VSALIQATVVIGPGADKDADVLGIRRISQHGCRHCRSRHGPYNRGDGIGDIRTVRSGSTGPCALKGIKESLEVFRMYAQQGLGQASGRTRLTPFVGVEEDWGFC